MEGEGREGTGREEKGKEKREGEGRERRGEEGREGRGGKGRGGNWEGRVVESPGRVRGSEPLPAPSLPHSLHHQAKAAQEQDGPKDTEEQNPGFLEIVASCGEPREQGKMLGATPLNPGSLRAQRAG